MRRPHLLPEAGRMKGASLINRSRVPGTGVTVNGQFYPFAKHFMDNRQAGRHSEATNIRIGYVLENPEMIEPPDGERQVFWRRIRDTGTGEWWMKVVIDREPSIPEILTAYRDVTGKGERLWRQSNT